MNNQHIWAITHLAKDNNSPAVAGSGKPIQQAVLPNWSAWNLTEQLPSGDKGSQEFGHPEACKSLLG